MPSMKEEFAIAINCERSKKHDKIFFNHKKTQHFTGQLMQDIPHFIGKIYSANLTHSMRYGIISGYTNAQLANLLKTGMTNEGKYIPLMIRPNLAEEDMADIFLYLRSNDK